LKEKIVAPVYKTEITAVGYPRADHTTHIYPQKLASTLPTSSGRSGGIVRSRTKAKELLLLLLYSKLLAYRKRANSDGYRIPAKWEYFQILREGNRRFQDKQQECMKDNELYTIVRIRISRPVWRTDKGRTNLVKDRKHDYCTFPHHFELTFVLQSRIESTRG
jgi:hypothetical protein